MLKVYQYLIMVDSIESVCSDCGSPNVISHADCVSVIATNKKEADMYLKKKFAKRNDSRILDYWGWKRVREGVIV